MYLRDGFLHILWVCVLCVSQCEHVFIEINNNIKHVTLFLITKLKKLKALFNHYKNVNFEIENCESML